MDIATRKDIGYRKKMSRGEIEEILKEIGFAAKGKTVSSPIARPPLGRKGASRDHKKTYERDAATGTSLDARRENVLASRTREEGRETDVYDLRPQGRRGNREEGGRATIREKLRRSFQKRRLRAGRVPSGKGGILQRLEEKTQKQLSEEGEDNREKLLTRGGGNSRLLGERSSFLITSRSASPKKVVEKLRGWQGKKEMNPLRKKIPSTRGGRRKLTGEKEEETSFSFIQKGRESRREKKASGKEKEKKKKQMKRKKRKKRKKGRRRPISEREEGETRFRIRKAVDSSSSVENGEWGETKESREGQKRERTEKRKISAGRKVCLSAMKNHLNIFGFKKIQTKKRGRDCFREKGEVGAKMSKPALGFPETRALLTRKKVQLTEAGRRRGDPEKK